MNLHSHYPYWLMKHGYITSYPSLKEDIHVDVAIIGAGISGALAAYYLKDSSLSIAVVDKRHVGMGSTAASTAFLQYEIDTPLHVLSKAIGEKNAVSSYEACRRSIYDLQKICNGLHCNSGFHIRPSLQYASFKKHKDSLYKEYQQRDQHGFAMQWLESDDVKRIFGFDAPGAILSEDAAEVDAYILTHILLSDFLKKGHALYNNTHITHIEHNKSGVELHTDDGLVIKAKKLIIASGYESLQYIPKKIAEVHSTYALVSEQVAQEKLWYKKSLIWETANPYLYFRITDNNRVLIGGKDDNFYKPGVRDARIKQKTDMLIKAFSKKIPELVVRKDFSWAGAFAVTKDGLPYIGSIPERPNTFFALGFGGNGITFSVIAAQIIRDLMLGHKNELASIFSFNR